MSKKLNYREFNMMQSGRPGHSVVYLWFFLLPCNNQLSSSIYHEIKFGDIAVM